MLYLFREEGKQRIQWISEKEAAKLVGLSPHTLRRYCVSGRLPIGYTQIFGRHYEYNKYDILRYKMDQSSYLLYNPKKVVIEEPDAFIIQTILLRIEDNQKKIIELLETMVNKK